MAVAKPALRFVTTRPVDFAEGNFFTGVRWVNVPAGTRVRVTETSPITGKVRVETRGRRQWAWISSEFLRSN
jgi:hypothetical protein